MKNLARYIAAVALSTVLISCQQPPVKVTQTSPPATQPPPQVTIEELATQTSVPTDTNEPVASPTEQTSAEPTAAEPEPTNAQAEPAATEESTSEPTATPTAEPTQAPDSSNQQATSGCEDKAAFFADITIPDDTPFKQSEEFEKIWRIRNEGSCTWDGYTLVWAGGSVFDAQLANQIPLTRPGDVVDIPVKMRAPNQGGLFTSLWEFENPSGKRFGVNSGGIDYIWVRISVTWYPEGSTSPGVSVQPTPTWGCNVEKIPSYIDQILALINDVRAKNGLAALTLEPRLSAAAQAHSEDMACMDYIDHTGSDGSNWADRVKAAGYKYSYVSENIYAGDPAFGGDAQGAFDWWMNSKIHRDNILSPKITQIGIGFASSTNAQFKGRYTLNFARP